MVVVFSQQQFIKLYEFNALVHYFYESEAHNGSAGVDAQYNTFVCQCILITFAG